MAKLQPMRYKNYVWPHNPRSYSITYHRRLTARGGAPTVIMYCRISDRECV